MTQHERRQQREGDATLLAPFSVNSGSTLLLVAPEPTIVPAIAHQGVLFIGQRARLEPSKNPIWIFNIGLAGVTRNVYDDG
jgi:hypothetical protein